MPQIISSTALRNGYNDVSERCRESSEPIYITKNGAGDLAVMGIDAYETMSSRLDFYEFLLKGRRDADAGRVISAREATTSLRERYGL